MAVVFVVVAVFMWNCREQKKYPNFNIMFFPQQTGRIINSHWMYRKMSAATYLEANQIKLECEKRLSANQCLQFHWRHFFEGSPGSSQVNILFNNSLHIKSQEVFLNFRKSIQTFSLYAVTIRKKLNFIYVDYSGQQFQFGFHAFSRCMLNFQCCTKILSLVLPCPGLKKDSQAGNIHSISFCGYISNILFRLPQKIRNSHERLLGIHMIGNYLERVRGK